MVSRSDTSKTIRRRTGGVGKKTGKGTTVRKINIDRHRWEDDPDFKGTPGPYNPRTKKMKKKKYDYEVYQDLGPMGPIGTVSYDADWPVAKRKHIQEGRLAEGSLTALEKKILKERDRNKVSDIDRKKYKAAGKKYSTAGETDMSNKKGGKLKKRKKSKTKKNKIMVGYKAGGKV